MQSVMIHSMGQRLRLRVEVHYLHMLQYLVYENPSHLTPPHPEKYSCLLRWWTASQDFFTSPFFPCRKWNIFSSWNHCKCERKSIISIIYMITCDEKVCFRSKPFCLVFWCSCKQLSGATTILTNCWFLAVTVIFLVIELLLCIFFSALMLFSSWLLLSSLLLVVLLLQHYVHWRSSVLVFQC